MLLRSRFVSPEKFSISAEEQYGSNNESDKGKVQVSLLFDKLSNLSPESVPKNSLDGTAEKASGNARTGVSGSARKNADNEVSQEPIIASQPLCVSKKLLKISMSCSSVLSKSGSFQAESAPSAASTCKLGSSSSPPMARKRSSSQPDEEASKVSEGKANSSATFDLLNKGQISKVGLFSQFQSSQPHHETSLSQPNSLKSYEVPDPEKVVQNQRPIKNISSEINSSQRISDGVNEAPGCKNFDQNWHPSKNISSLERSDTAAFVQPPRLHEETSSKSECLGKVGSSPQLQKKLATNKADPESNRAGSKGKEDDRKVDPYVDFTEFFENVAIDGGESVVFSDTAFTPKS